MRFKNVEQQNKKEIECEKRERRIRTQIKPSKMRIRWTRSILKVWSQSKGKKQEWERVWVKETRGKAKVEEKYIIKVNKIRLPNTKMKANQSHQIYTHTSHTHTVIQKNINKNAQATLTHTYAVVYNILPTKMGAAPKETA